MQTFLRGLLALAFAACTASPALAQFESLIKLWPGSREQIDGQLLKVVIVSRHGVRTPLPPASELATWAAQPWPVWGEAPGALTSRGAELMTIMGKYYREYLGAQGALPVAGCPAQGSIFVYADSTSRTQATGQALIDGFAKDCGFVVKARTASGPDPLFHPLAAGVCKLDPTTALMRIVERTGGDPNRATRDQKASYASLQSVLECCKPSLCTAFGRGEKCGLGDLPTALAASPDGSGVSLVGALPIASSASELILLEYLDGMSLPDVGWGRATPERMREGVRLHTEYYDLMQRTPYIARKMASALLFKTAAAVTSSRQLGFGVIDSAVRDAKLVVLVGHDTNIWNMAGALDVTWTQTGYQRNQTPPGGALMFEVRENQDKKILVYTSYVAQSIDQMRNATPLTGEVQPLKTMVRVPGCSSAAYGFPCTLEEFAIAVRNSLDRDCLE